MKEHTSCRYYSKGKCWYTTYVEGTVAEIVGLLQPHARLRIPPDLYPLDFNTQKLLIAGNNKDWGGITADPFLNALFSRDYSPNTVSTYYSLVGRLIRICSITNNEDLKKYSPRQGKRLP